VTAAPPPRQGRRWHRHPRQMDAEKPPVAFPGVTLYGPYADRHDLWLGLYWVHQVQGWDGGWREGWRFYVAVPGLVVLRVDVDRSLRATRAYRRWAAASGVDPCPGYRRWRAAPDG
jgi:hypothetical protein